MTTALANAFAPSNYPGMAAQTGGVYPLAIDNALAALAFVASPYQPTVTNADMVVHVAAGVIPTLAGITTVAAQTVTLATANATNPRIDRVVLDRITLAASVLTGTAAATPTAPTIPAGKLPCLQMLVPASATVILNTNGIDERALWLAGAKAAALMGLGIGIKDDGTGGLTLDVTGLTAAGSVDATNDMVAFWSNAAGALRKASISQLGGVTATDFLALQQDVMEGSLREALDTASAAGQYVNGGYDAFTSDTIGVNSTNQTYDGANKLYGNPGGYTANLIPTMTSNTAPSGTCSGDQAQGGNYDFYFGFLPFNSGTGFCWQHNSGGGAGWLGYTFTSAKVVSKYSFCGNSGNSALRAPKTWTFEGWNGSSWVVLDTQTNQTAWAVGEVRSFSIANVTSYIQYRLNITANNGDGTYINVCQFQMFGVLTPLNMTLVSSALASASAPTQVKLMVLWKDLSGSAVLNTDFTAEATRDGATWTAGTLSDTGLTIAGFKVLWAVVDVSAQPSGTTVKYRLKTLNTKSQQVKGVALMTK